MVQFIILLLCFPNKTKQNKLRPAPCVSHRQHVSSHVRRGNVHVGNAVEVFANPVLCVCFVPGAVGLMKPAAVTSSLYVHRHRLYESPGEARTWSHGKQKGCSASMLLHAHARAQAGCQCLLACTTLGRPFQVAHKCNVHAHEHDLCSNCRGPPAAGIVYNTLARD